uniref:GBP-binding protein n=1 Tax=Helicoverpa armigera armigera TaxID=52318 RepID=A0A3G1LBD4_HELAM|nr:GBP-binding protein [Helicoverpa armigera armigera]
MYSITNWKNAKKPNYNTNVDKLFPYSEVPYLGEYNLVKIPVSLNNLIQHVDYWGEGRIVSEDGITGFTNCYNVHHQYHVVSGGADRDSKIPNRIPVASCSECDTSAYIRDNSVITVTVTDASRINTSCAKDIARIVNNDLGRVVVYGSQPDSGEILILTMELQKRALYACPDADLFEDLRGLKFVSHVAFLNKLESINYLYKNITNSNYERAIMATRSLADVAGGQIIDRLINDAPRTAMSYAYKLWNGGARDVVRNYFPKPFQHIFNEDAVTIANLKFRQPLKLDVHKDSYGDRLVWGDNACDLSSERVSWKLIPVWDNDGVTFKLYNIDCSMYLKLDVNVDNIGDRKAWGSNNSDELRHRYYLEPGFKNGSLVFHIVNCKYNQGLKLAVAVDGYGDRLLWGHGYEGDIDDNRLCWNIQAF